VLIDVHDNMSPPPAGPTIAYVSKRAPVLMLTTNTCSYGLMSASSSSSVSMVMLPS
jgi:hypothetical protein